MSTDYSTPLFRRSRKTLGEPAVSRSERDRARLTVASLAIQATDTDAEAVEATRDVLDMLGIGSAA